MSEKIFLIFPASGLALCYDGGRLSQEGSMRPRACHLLIAIALLGTTQANTLGTTQADTKKVYPNRWVRISSGLREDADVEKIRKLIQIASDHGLTGVAFSAGLDQLDLKSPDYFRRLKEVREICAQRKMEIIPSFMSAGYGGAVLAHDKNLAAGLPVRDALFVVSRGGARLTPDPPVVIL